MGEKNSFEVWRGPSEINGEPIVMILTMRSANRKTGPMAQTTILSQAQPPHEAQASGSDAAVCGSCPLRPSTAKDGAPRCYVRTFHAPLALWRAWINGGIRPYSSESEGGLQRRLEADGLTLRLGAYGDPAAVPIWVWDSLVPSTGHTGYTHRWRENPSLSSYCMASVETDAEGVEARALGYRTYRVALDGVGPTRSEIACPHESRGITCNSCGLCAGSSRLQVLGTKSIVVQPI